MAEDGMLNQNAVWSAVCLGWRLAELYDNKELPGSPGEVAEPLPPHLPGLGEMNPHEKARALAAHVGADLASLGKALAAEDALSRDSAPQPTYSRLAGPVTGTVDSHTARTLTEIGDLRGTEARHRAAFTSWDPAAFPRVHLLTYMDLGDCLATQGRVDEAVAAWSRALDLAEGMASARTRSALASIRPALTGYRRRGVPGAATLQQRMQQAAV